MTNSIVTEGQSLLDVAVQELGTVAALFELADANGQAITDALAPGRLLTVPTAASTRPDVVAVLAGQRINTDADGTCYPQLPNYLPDFQAGDWLVADFLTTP